MPGGPTTAAFRGLAPGVATRTEVEAKLGKPVAGADPALRYDYSPATSQDDLARLTVTYYAAAPIVQGIEIELRRRPPRADFVKWFKLQGPTHRGVVGGKLVEMYIPDGLALNYSGADASGPVSSFAIVDGSLPPEAFGGTLGVSVALPRPAPDAAHAGDPAPAEEHGCSVVNFSQDSPAQKAGILAKDVIVTVDGEEVLTAEKLREVVLRSVPGAALRVGVLREGKPVDVQVVVGGVPASAALGARAQRHSAAARFDEAFADADKAVRLAPRSADAFAARGWVWLERAQAMRDKTVFEKGLPDLAEAIRIDPKLARAYVGRATVLLMSGRAADANVRADALADLSAGIELDPRSARAYFLRTQIYRQLGDFDKSLDDATQCVKLDPLNGSAWFQRGMAWVGKGRHDKAVEDFTHASLLSPKDASIYLWRGYAWSHSGNVPAARADFTKAVELDPTGDVGKEARKRLAEPAAAPGPVPAPNRNDPEKDLRDFFK